MTGPGLSGGPDPGSLAARLAVVIVSYETRAALDACLLAVRSALPGVEVVVVDNASTDGSAEMTRQRHPWARLLVLPRNAGFAAGVNAGITATTQPYVLVLNPDVAVTAAAVHTLVETLDADPRAGGVSPLLLDPDGAVQAHLYRRFPGPGQVLLFWSVLAPLARALPPVRRRWLEHPLPHGEASDVEQLPGGAMLLRRAALEDTGPLDEGFFIWFEDVDWCYRATLAGWRLLVQPAARMAHEGGASFRGWAMSRRVLQFYRAGLRFLAKHDLPRALAVARRVVPTSVDLRYRVLGLLGRASRQERHDARASLVRVLREVDRGRVPDLTGSGPDDIAASSKTPVDAAVDAVDVVVVNWNGIEYLPRCLEALFRSTARISVTVVDNASTDGSAEYVRSRWPEVRLIAYEENRGYAGGANGGLREGTGRYAFVMNPDLLVAPDHLAVLRDRLDRQPEVGAAQGRFLRIDPADFREMRPSPQPRELDSAGQVMRRRRLAEDRGQGQPDGPPYQAEAAVFSACGAGLFLRREMLDDVGPDGAWFDPVFFAYKEDVDLGWRARLHGWEVLYVPSAVAEHVRALPGGDRNAWRRMSPAARRHSWKNHYLMEIKNDRLRDLLRSLPHVVAWELGRIGWALLREPSLLRAYVEVARCLPHAFRERRRILAAARRRGVDPAPWFGRDTLERTAPAVPYRSSIQEDR